MACHHISKIIIDVIKKFILVMDLVIYYKHAYKLQQTLQCTKNIVIWKLCNSPGVSLRGDGEALWLVLPVRPLDSYLDNNFDLV